MGPFRDDLQRVLGVPTGQQGGRDGHRPVDPPLTLLGGLVQPGVADGDTGLGRQHPDHVDVVVVEGAPAALLAQIEVPEDLSLDADGNTEKATHPRMVLGKTPGPRILAHIRQPHRPRLPDERAEQPLVPVGKPPDAPRGPLVDPVEDEVGKRVTVLVDDTDPRVAGVRQRGRRLADPLQRGVQFEPAPHGPHRREQLRHAGSQFGRGSRGGGRGTKTRGG